MKARKLLSYLTAATLAAGMIVSGLPSIVNASDTAITVNRLEGADRYETAEKTALAAYPDGAGSAVIVSGENYPDALSAAALAGLIDAPLLLNENSSAVNSYTAAALSKLGTKNIVLVGGTSSLPESLQTALENEGFSVTRIAGTDRSDTSYQVYAQGEALAEKLTGKKKTWNTQAIVASGSGFADAISISPYAAASATPIFLTGTDGLLSEEIRKALSEESGTIIVGGTGAVSSGAEASAGNNCIRLAGATRYETSCRVAAWLLGEDKDLAVQPAVLFNNSKTAFTDGTNFPDALTGSVLQAERKSPLILTTDDASENAPVLEFAGGSLAGASEITVIGGRSAVSEADVEKIENAIEGSSATDSSTTDSSTTDSSTTDSSTAQTSTDTFTFTDSAVTASEASASGVTISGTALTITAAGTYTLTGSCTDGSVTVAKGAGTVTLILDGLTLNSTASDSNTIGAKSGNVLNLIVKDGTSNTVSNNGAVIYTTEDGTTDVDNAPTIKMGDTGTISGTGSLTVINEQKNAVKGDVLTISEASLNLRAGLKSAFTADTVGSGINCDTSLTIESGSITVNAYNDGLHSDGTLTINGGTVNIGKCEEGLEGNVVTVAGGNISIAAEDDCLNASGDDDSNAAYGLVFTGGTLYAVTNGGDGLDSNGYIRMSGGSVTVFCAGNNEANTAIDYDEKVGSFDISGGTLLAAGPTGMMGGAAPGTASTQSFLDYDNVSIAANSTFYLTDSSGNLISSRYTAPVTVTNVIYSASSLTSGSSYVLCSGSTALGTATAGTGSAGTAGGTQPGGSGQPGGSIPGGAQPGGTHS